MTVQRVFALALAVALSLTGPASASAPTPDELAQMRRWSDEHFRRARVQAAPETAEPAKPGLIVRDNYGPVHQNARDGQPLKIADRQYTRGLYCHAVSEILVRLPGPGRSFAATVGIDTNGNYSGGSAEFMVHVAGKRVFCSPTMQRGEPGVAVDVELDDATEFTISVGTAGDNINSDQASWADAHAVLADGREIWLGDLPLLPAEVRRREGAVPPFSFVYGDKHSDGLLPSWEYQEDSRPLGAGKTQRTQTYTDPQTGLSVRCEIVQYDNYPTVEWTLYFKNTGAVDTPILEDIRALDSTFQRSGNAEFLLHHFVGSPCAANDYQPLEAVLTPETAKRITTQGGRPTNSDLPYFNVETGGGGVIAVVSWAGQWAADFLRDANDNLRICGGQERTHFRLHPGEEVRSPLAVLQFYQGDWIRGQNVWRSWMVEHNLPRPGGKPLTPMISACNGNHYPGHHYQRGRGTALPPAISGRGNPAGLLVGRRRLVPL